jgi:hypothetical protein
MLAPLADLLSRGFLDFDLSMIAFSFRIQPPAASPAAFGAQVSLGLARAPACFGATCVQSIVLPVRLTTIGIKMGERDWRCTRGVRSLWRSDWWKAGAGAGSYLTSHERERLELPQLGS